MTASLCELTVYGYIRCIQKVPNEVNDLCLSYYGYFNEKMDLKSDKDIQVIYDNPNEICYIERIKSSYGNAWYSCYSSYIIDSTKNHIY